MIKTHILENRKNGISMIRMQSQDVDMIVSNLGCHILSIRTKDRLGYADEICLGYKEVEDCHKGGGCLGAICGRVANRIAGGRFELNGNTYQLAINNGPNHLHGGIEGFDQKIFDYDIGTDFVTFSYFSPDQEEGYPGNLRVKITYSLQENVFTIDYEMASDQDTIVNLTNHAYFNLSGTDPEGKHAFRDKVENHKLKMNSDLMGCVDGNGLTFGEIREVSGTPFDFRDFHQIGESIYQDDDQLKNGNGYDHPFILKNGHQAAVLYHEGTGRMLTITTTYPTIHVYTGNFLAGGPDGRHGLPYENRDGIALEAQYLANSIHIEKNPPVILRKGEVRREQTKYIFNWK